MKIAKSVTMSLYKYACRLTSVARFSGLNLGRNYSVAEHSYRVIILGMTITHQYNKENPNNKISVEEVVLKAACHDLEESVLNDLPSPIKNLDPEFKVAYKKLGTRVMKDIILPGSPEPELYLKLWVEDKEGPTGEVVKVADLLEGFCTVCYELKRGNKVLSKAFNKYVEQFEKGDCKHLLEKFTLAKQIYLENKAMVNSGQTKKDEGFEAA